MGHSRRTMHRGAKPSTFQIAHYLRNKETEAEKKLWECLRDKRFNGVKFRRQHPVKDYVIDFYTQKFKLGIEIDGEYHNDKVQKFYDEDRSQIITEKGIRMIRFTNDEVMNSIEAVLETIKSHFQYKN